MTTRRELLTAMPGLLFPANATENAPQSRIDDLAEDLAKALSEELGGQWKWDRRSSVVAFVRITKHS